jgi:hypothetical protein
MKSIDRAAKMISKEAKRGMMNEKVANLDGLYDELKTLPGPSWNSFMADIQRALPGTIPTDTLNKSLSKLVGRKP